MAEAEEELIKEYPIQANKIRDSRIKMEKDNKYNDDLDGLLSMVDKECDTCALNHNHQPECKKGQKFNHTTGRCE
jgi:hypothetical protein